MLCLHAQIYLWKWMKLNTNYTYILVVNNNEFMNLFSTIDVISFTKERK